MFSLEVSNNHDPDARAKVYHIFVENASTSPLFSIESFSEEIEIVVAEN